MVNLERLNMSACCKKIPDYNNDGGQLSFFKDLVNLKSLDISLTQWENITNAQSLLYSCDKLTYLNMASITSVLDVSKVFQKQVNLQSVDLSNCINLRVGDFKFESTNITEFALKGLNLRPSQMAKMKTSFGLPDPSSLKQLDLTGTSVYVSIGYYLLVLLLLIIKPFQCTCKFAAHHLSF